MELPVDHRASLPRIRFRGGQGNPRLEPPYDREPVILGLLQNSGVIEENCQADRHERVGGSAQPAKSPGRYPNDGERPAMEANLPPDDGALAAETLLPQGVSEHHDGGLARDRVLSRLEEAPGGGLHSQHLEVVSGNFLRGEALGSFPGDEIQIGRSAVARDPLERRGRPAEQLELGIGPGK
jgi:hypothetical protein